jgi:hypothetical protein
VRWTLICYGWRDRTVESGVALLTSILGRRFFHREGRDVGDAFYAFLYVDRERTGKITVLPNARPGSSDKDWVLRWNERGYSDHATLVVVDGVDLSGWLDRETEVVTEAGLDRLYREGLGTAGRTIVYDLEPSVKFRELHEYCFGFGDTPMDEVAAVVGREIGTDLREKSDPFVAKSYEGRAEAITVEVLENGGDELLAQGAYAAPWHMPEHPQHRVLLWVNTSDPRMWGERLSRLTDSGRAELLRHEVTRSRV